MSTYETETDDNGPIDITDTVTSRYFILPASAAVVGTLIGMVRGSRLAALRFLAENAHRPPTTVRGWYFYNKTKNYRRMQGGLKAAGVDGSKLALTALGWVGIEDGLQRMGLNDVSEFGAGIGTAGVFSAVYRLPWRTTGRTLVIGAMIGGGMRFLRWAQEYLRETAKTQAAEVEHATSSEEQSGGNKSV